MIYLYFIYFNILTNQKNIVIVYNKNDINLKEINLNFKEYKSLASLHNCPC